LTILTTLNIFSTTVVSIVRMVAMNSLDLTTNLTGTMIYADFLSAFEVNLGIFCVSLPMLGPIYARYIRRGGPGTTLSGNKASGGPGNSSSHLRTFGTGKQSKHRRLDDGAVGADTVYDHGGQQGFYNTTVGHKDAGSDGHSGSDIELVSNAVQQKTHDGIQVERKWVVRVGPNDV
jgi:hypothetical protein